MPRPDVSVERKLQILDAAAIIFSRDGIDGSRMDDIASESGLSKAAIYHYFKSKDDIIIALVQKLFDMDVAAFELLIDSTLSAREQLRHYIQQLMTLAQEQEMLMRVAYEFYARAVESGAIRDTLQLYYAQYHGIIEQILQKGIQNDEFVPMDTGLAATGIIGLVEGMFLINGIFSVEGGVEARLMFALDTFLNGLQA